MPLVNRVGGGGAELQSKSVTPTTSSQTVMPDAGYDGLSQVTVNRIPTTYVQPSATQAAQTITPSTSNQYIYAGTYCSGQQTIQGDADLAAENIKSGVSIFGVTGTHVPSTGSAVTATARIASMTFNVPTDNLIGFIVSAYGRVCVAENTSNNFAQITMLNGEISALVVHYTPSVYVGDTPAGVSFITDTATLSIIIDSGTVELLANQDTQFLDGDIYYMIPIYA